MTGTLTGTISGQFQGANFSITFTLNQADAANAQALVTLIKNALLGATGITVAATWTPQGVAMI